MRKFVLTLLSCVLLPASLAAQQEDTETLTLLADKEAGPWLCAYYLIDSNEELEGLTLKEWAGVCADETDWIQGYGPLSNSPDAFRTTDWWSQRQALLLRRHFTLTAEDVAALSQSSVVLRCSYDENPRVYLNGTLVWNASGWNDNDYARFAFSRRQRQLLREGDNVLAVSLMSGQGGGHIDLSLTLSRPLGAAVAPPAATPPAGEPWGAATLFLPDGRPADPSAALHPGIYISHQKKIILR